MRDTWIIFDIGGTREATRQRALPKTENLPPPFRRLDDVCAPGYTGRKHGEIVRTRVVVSQALDRQAHSTVPNAAPHGCATRPNSAPSSGRIVDSLVEWHLGREDQASLVPVSDWPMRATTRDMYRPYHDREILQTESRLAETILAAIDARGPLSSLEFESDTRRYEPGSWAGSTSTKRALRAMWVCGILVTHIVRLDVITMTVPNASFPRHTIMHPP